MRLSIRARFRPHRGLVAPGNRMWKRNWPSCRSLDRARVLKEAGFTWSADRTDHASSSDGKPVKFSVQALQPDRANGGAHSGGHKQLEWTFSRSLEFRSLLDRVTQTKRYEACVMGFSFDADPNSDIWRMAIKRWGTLESFAGASGALWKRSRSTDRSGCLRALLTKGSTTINRRFSLRTAMISASPIFWSCKDSVGNFRPPFWNLMYSECGAALSQSAPENVIR